ncbi:MAG: ArsR family transcriptional regulator [Candidatus Caldarchaeales archaeon]
MIEIPKVLINIPKIISILTDEKLEILKSLHGGIKNSRDLAKKLGKDESTVRRHLAELIALDLVKSIKRKPLIVKTSKLVEGIIFLAESD